jgi:hypothetical protein
MLKDFLRPAASLALGWLLAALFFTPLGVLTHVPVLAIMLLSVVALDSGGHLVSERVRRRESSPLPSVLPAWARLAARLCAIAAVLVYAFGIVPALVPVLLVLALTVLPVAVPIGPEDEPLPEGDEPLELPEGREQETTARAWRGPALLMSLLLLVPSLAHASALHALGFVPGVAGIDTALLGSVVAFLGLGGIFTGLALKGLKTYVLPQLKALLDKVGAWFDAELADEPDLEKIKAAIWSDAEAAVLRTAADTVDAAKAASDDGKVPAEVGKAALAKVVSDVRSFAGPLWMTFETALGKETALHFVVTVVEAIVKKRNEAKAKADAAKVVLNSAIVDATPTAQSSKTLDVAAHLDAAKAAAELAVAHEMAGNTAAAADAHATADNLATAAKLSSEQLVASLTASNAPSPAPAGGAS